MSFRRGGQRLGFGLVLLWFLYWTCANVLGAPSFDSGAPSPASLTLPMEIVVIVAAILLAPWIVSGFRSGSDG
jgi:hypothetical protein